jgi:hypothetical protein
MGVEPPVAGRDATPLPARLLPLLGVERVLPQGGRVLLQLQLLAAGLAAKRVVQFTRFLAHEVNDLEFLLSLRHRVSPVSYAAGHPARSLPSVRAEVDHHHANPEGLKTPARAARRGGNANFSPSFFAEIIGLARDE